jgi:hypothetical protein
MSGTHVAVAASGQDIGKVLAQKTRHAARFPWQGQDFATRMRQGSLALPGFAGRFPFPDREPLGFWAGRIVSFGRPVAGPVA